MRIILPEFATKKEMFSYLLKNKKSLINQKKSLPITSDPFTHDAQIKTSKDGEYSIATKANNPVIEDVDQLRVRVVANTSNWIDSHMDMILPDAAKKSIAERKGIIPHLHDHIHQIEAEIGKVVDITLPVLSFAELGIKGTGQTQVIQFLTDVLRSDNEKVFEKYKQGRILQHSIGLQYIQLELAINDEDSEKEFDFWNKHFPNVIN